MSVKIRTIRDAIKSKLESIPSIEAVYNHMVVGGSGYPLACLYPSGLENSLLTNKEEHRAYAFKIVLQQETKIAWKDQASEIILDTFDDVLESLSHDWNLSDLVTNIRPIPSDFGEINDEEWIILYAEITVMVEIISDPIN